MVTRSKFFMLLILTLLCQQVWAVEINARLNATQVMEGDTVKLTVTIDATADNKEPDFSVLEQQFEILSTYKAERSNIVNGRFSSVTSWVLTLLPRSLGYVAVPPIPYENAETKPLKLHVTQRTANNQTDQYLFVDASLSREQAYVQEQVIYTVRIFRFNVDIYDPSYEPPSIDNVAMEQLGEQRNYKTTLNGQQYDVFEFRYALFPQKSGKIEIPAARLNATVFRAGNRPRGFGFDPFNGKQVRRQSPILALDVKSIPAEYPKDKPWLPAKSLALTESWSPDDGKARIGDPVTRTVTMQAEGVLPTILPALPSAQLQGLKIYPEPADSSSSVGENGMIGSRTESQAIIATQAGDYQLPPVSITWWDVDEQKVRISELPAHSLTVSGTANRPQMDTTTAPPASLPQLGDQPPPTLTQPGSVNRTWQWLALGALTLWLVTLAALIWLWFNRKQNVSDATATKPGPTPFSDTLRNKSRRELQSACEQNNAKGARSALIQYCRQHWRDNSIDSLDGIVQREQNPSLQSEIRKLNASLYRDKQSNWQGAGLWNAINQTLKEPESAQKQPALQPLHPNQA